MKLLLCSSGFTNEAIIAALENLSGKSRADLNFVIINEAIKAEKGDHRWFAEGLAEITNNFGGAIEMVDIQAHDLEYVRERIEHADAIFCFGGDTNYLAGVFHQSGFDKILPSILQEKIWVGSSAGSCVLCHQNSAKIDQEIYQDEPTTNEYLNIVPIIFLPHYHSDWFNQLDQDAVITESNRKKLPIYALSDQAALIMQGESEDLNFRLIGKDYLVAQNGKVSQQN